MGLPGAWNLVSLCGNILTSRAVSQAFLGAGMVKSQTEAPHLRTVVQRLWAGLPPLQTGNWAGDGVIPPHRRVLGFPKPHMGVKLHLVRSLPILHFGRLLYFEGLQGLRSLGSLDQKMAEVLSSPNSCPPKSRQLNIWRQVRGLWANWGTQRKVLWGHLTAEG